MKTFAVAILLASSVVALGQARSKAPTYKEVADELARVKADLTEAKRELADLREENARLKERIARLSPPPLDQRIKEGIAQGKPVVGMTEDQCIEAMAKYHAHISHESSDRTVAEYRRLHDGVLGSHIYTVTFVDRKVDSINNHNRP